MRTQRLVLLTCLLALLHAATVYPQSGWYWQNPLPTGNALFGVFFTDANTGTVVGDVGTILRTTNGGATWSNQASGTTATLNGVS
ncbi:MAG: hypothetical protein AAB393_01195, partial [Bacteroidota bacterium]